MSNDPNDWERPEDQLVPPKRRKTRLVEKHKSGILIPPWWRKNRAFALLAVSVAAVIGAIVVIGSASERVGHVPDVAGYGVETFDDLARHEEPLPTDVYEGAPVVISTKPEDGVLHAIEDPGAQVRAEPIGELIGELGLDEPPAEQAANDNKAGALETQSAATTEIPETPPAPEVEVGDQVVAEAAPEVARLPEPTTPVPSPRQSTDDAVPAWIRYALPFEPQPNKPLIAIVIDDVGVSRHYSAEAIDLPGPLTMSFLTYADHVNEQAERAREHGHEIMLHVPMEPSSATIDPGPNALLTELPEAELRARLTWGMGQLDGYVGINNHMGSRFTQDSAGMRIVLETISRSGHFFLDSRTSGGSVAGEIAHDLGMPFASRNVFLDHEDDADVIRQQLAQTERLAARNGAVIAIGHPRPATVEVLREWIPTVEAKGFQLAPITAIVRQQWLAEIAAQLEAAGDG